MSTCTPTVGVFLVFCLFVHCECEPTPTAEAVTTAHVVFMNHLDVGYTDFSLRVLNLYMNKYFPKSLKTSKDLPAKHSNETYLYTTQPFLLWTLIHCEEIKKITRNAGDTMLECPTKDVVEAVKKGVQTGQIYFQAFPHNAEPENYDPQVFNASLQIAKEVALHYGVKPPTVMSQRDVPGMTVGVIPHLIKNGIKAVTIGCNGGATPPKVPKMFIWKHPNLKDEMLTLVHPGGYGGDHLSDCVEWKGNALCWGFRGDNAGPHTVKEAEEVFTQVRKNYPKAKVIASTHDAFVEAVLKAGTSGLPVITGEMGDTWIHGVEADPWKEAAYRATCRVRNECVAKKKCNVEDSEMKMFDFLLSKLGEHTFGGDSKRFLANWVTWSNKELHKKLVDVKRHLAFDDVIKTWKEQRDFLSWGIDAVKDNKYFHDELMKTLSDISPTQLPNLSHFTKVKNTNMKFTAGDITFSFGPNGEIATLLLSDGTQFAAGNKKLFKLQYHTHNEKDISKFLHEYIFHQPPPNWCYFDYGKPGCQLFADPVSATWYPILNEVYSWNNNNKKVSTFLASVDWLQTPHEKYGTPSVVWVNVTIEVQNSSPSVLYYTLNTYHKTPTRILEAMWLSVDPVVPPHWPKDLWSMDKLGTTITTADTIVDGGAKHMHVVQDHVTFKPGGPRKMEIQPWDTGLISVGSARIFPTPTNVTADPTGGIHFNLHNNLWDTNYPLWYPFVLSPSEVGINQTYRWKVSFPKATFGPEGFR
eukprot:TRINITY_DN67625_c6_g1_i1.p1 TRINITY_DN67625_c6_g1~~TRINITY_DN67625_c6_g1_i1.p1  ORF type:complete len:752 (-),score=89.33 TRINITY_DN67625_c6_g1_i1:2-2257(-)